MNDTLLEEAQHSYTIMEQSMRGKPWHLTIFRDFLRLEATGVEAFAVSKDSAPEQVELMRPFMGGAILAVKANKRLVFRLDAPQQAAIEQWLGPPTRRTLAIALKKRFSWGLILGVLFIFSSLPIAGDPARGIKDLPFDPLSLLLGLVLIALRLVAKIRPNRTLFLVDSIWFLVLAGKVIFDIVQGSNWLWGFVSVVCLMASYSALGLYSRFRNVQA